MVNLTQEELRRQTFQPRDRESTHKDTGTGKLHDGERANENVRRRNGLVLLGQKN